MTVRESFGTTARVEFSVMAIEWQTRVNCVTPQRPGWGQGWQFKKSLPLPSLLAEMAC